MFENIIDRLFANREIIGTCWIYTAGKRTNGYGTISYKGKDTTVHRLSMHIWKGFDLNSEKLILHDIKCISKACFNYDHLREGNHSNNAEDHIKSGKFRNHNTEKTHCKRGHEFTLENTRVVGNTRECKKCAILMQQKRRKERALK